MGWEGVGADEEEKAAVKWWDKRGKEKRTRRVFLLSDKGVSEPKHSFRLSQQLT